MNHFSFRTFTEKNEFLKREYQEEHYSLNLFGHRITFMHSIQFLFFTMQNKRMNQLSRPLHSMKRKSVDLIENNRNRISDKCV